MARRRVLGKMGPPTALIATCALLPLVTSQHGPPWGQLYNRGFYEGDIVLRSGTKNAYKESDLLWPYGAIPFKPDESIGCPESRQCGILMQAMQVYHEASCVRFKEWTGERDYVQVFFNQDSGACWSQAGRAGGGRQHLSLGRRCWYPGIVAHELGHVVGLRHEMNRPDRDRWLYVHWGNIMPGLESAFAVHDRRLGSLDEKFDYKSIMMYDEYAFSKDGESPTLQARTRGVLLEPLWRKRGLSAGDARRLNKLYRCEQGDRPKRGFPYDVRCSFTADVCGFKADGGAAWAWRNANTTGGHLAASLRDAGLAEGRLVSVNMHPAGKTSGPSGCVRFWYLLRADEAASLKLTQAYLIKVTQLSYDPESSFDLWENATVTGQWTHVEMPLYVTKSFKLIFTSKFYGVTGEGYIALDDVELLYTPCTFASTAASAAGRPASLCGDLEAPAHGPTIAGGQHRPPHAYHDALLTGPGV